MKHGDKIALAALLLSILSAIVAATTFFTRGALATDELRADIGDPSVPSGLYGQVAEARGKAETAIATADAARTDAATAREEAFEASKHGATAKSDAESAKGTAEQAREDIDEARAVADAARRDAAAAVASAAGALRRSVPVGTILAWVPTPGHPRPPEAWAICNGKNGTPDLTDRFLIGTKYPDKTQETGGSNTITPDGAHNHGGSTGEAPESGKPKENGNDGHHTHAHRHSIGKDGTHDHGGDNRPLFYSVVFVMKTSS